MTRLFESTDGARIAPLALVETIEGEQVELLRLREAHPGLLTRRDDGWRELAVPEELPSPGVRQCVRCRRLNFGPCVSATCHDLQAPPEWLAPLIDPRWP